MGQQTCWLMIDLMTADVCDEDELRTGLRREGMFGAVKSPALKAGVAFTGLTGGLVAGILVFVFYPITRAKSSATRRILNERKLS